MKRIFTIWFIVMGLLNLSVTVSAVSFDQTQLDKDYSEYYEVVQNINEEYGTQFSISKFEKVVDITPEEFASFLEEFIARTESIGVLEDEETVVISERRSDIYYKTATRWLISDLRLKYEAAYKIADNGNDLYFVENPSDDYYYFTSDTYGYIDVHSFSDNISDDRLTIYIDLFVSYSISSGGIVVPVGTFDGTVSIHINEMA